MLTIKQIRSDKEYVIKALCKKHFDAKELLDRVVALDDKRKQTQKDAEELLCKQNVFAKEIGALMKQGKKEEAEKAKLEVATLKAQSKELSDISQETESEIRDILLSIPNIPSPLVPEGKAAEDNLCVKQHGEIPSLGDDAMPHWDIAKKCDIIDFELGVKISGAGFPVYKGYGARLQRALINFFLDRACKAGFVEVQPPYVVNEDSGYGTGQLPDKEGQMYHVGIDNLYLIPTAEVPVTNIYRDVILQESELPVKNTAYSACFRREAGSYGKDVRGLNRLHQFDKVEIVVIDKPENSYKRLDEMVQYVESLVTELELPWRILRLCGGDMSFTSALTYDFEVFSAAQKRWLEVSSVSNFESYQANRLKLRYKNKEGKTELAHTLNGSALALPRIVAAILENNQTKKGIVIPKALVPFTGFDIIPL